MTEHYVKGRSPEEPYRVQVYTRTIETNLVPRLMEAAKEAGWTDTTVSEVQIPRSWRAGARKNRHFFGA